MGLLVIWAHGFQDAGTPVAIPEDQLCLERLLELHLGVPGTGGLEQPFLPRSPLRRQASDLLRGDEANLLDRTGDYVVANLRSEYQLGRTVRLFARIENLFDTGYETVSGYGTLGRTAHVGARAKF